MPPTTMCAPIPTMGTGRHSKHGAPHDAVPRFRAGGDESSHPAGAAVKGGGNCIHPNGKRLDFLATNVTKKLDHYMRSL